VGGVDSHQQLLSRLDRNRAPPPPPRSRRACQLNIHTTFHVPCMSIFFLYILASTKYSSPNTCQHKMRHEAPTHLAVHSNTFVTPSTTRTLNHTSLNIDDRISRATTLYITHDLPSPLTEPHQHILPSRQRQQTNKPIPRQTYADSTCHAYEQAGVAASAISTSSSHQHTHQQCACFQVISHVLRSLST
jgi:hypothetical protein